MTGRYVGLWLLIALLCPARLLAQAGASSNSQIPSAPGSALAADDTIAPGTVITMQNWQNYKQFMPDGMAAFFQGKYFWKMAPDVRMPVGPTIIHPLPQGLYGGYREAFRAG